MTDELYSDDVQIYDPLEVEQLKSPEQIARDSNGIFDEENEE